MSHKIKTEHLGRLAAVYIRQSSPGQVRNNTESYRVQKGLVTRAEQLGWPASQIKLFEADHVNRIDACVDWGLYNSRSVASRDTILRVLSLERPMCRREFPGEAGTCARHSSSPPLPAGS